MNMKAIFAVMNAIFAVVKIRCENPPSLPAPPPSLPPSLPAPLPPCPPSLPAPPPSLPPLPPCISFLGTKHQNNAKDMFEDLFWFDGRGSANHYEVDDGYQEAVASLQASAPEAEANYAQVDMTKKKKNRRPPADEYAQVDKSKKTKKRPKVTMTSRKVLCHCCCTFGSTFFFFDVAQFLVWTYFSGGKAFRVIFLNLTLTPHLVLRFSLVMQRNDELFSIWFKANLFRSRGD